MLDQKKIITVYGFLHFLWLDGFYAIIPNLVETQPSDRLPKLNGVFILQGFNYQLLYDDTSLTETHE